IGQPEACTGSLRVKLSVAPEIAEPLQTIADRIAGDKVPVDGACVAFEINRARPRDVFNRLSNDASDSPDLWIPDTWEWVSRIGIPHDRLLSLSPSVAASPLVLATTRSGADAVRSQAGSWASLAPAGKMALGDAEKSGVALSALLAIRRSLSDEPDVARDKLGTVILRLIKQRVADLGVELDQAGRGGGLRRGVPATEQQVLSVHREHPQADIVPVVPKSGTVLLDYPLVAVLHGKPRGGRLIEAGAALMRYVDSPRGRSALRTAGFRDYRDQVPPSDPGNVGDVKVLSPITMKDADDVLRSWAAMSLESRLLAVVDVSGSMVVPAGDRSRIELARDAARTALSYFPDTSQVGLWEFSQNRDGPRGYLQLSPTGTLSAKHRQELDKDLDRLPQQVGGGTALYDTFFAAYHTAQGGYDPSRVNSLVLLTDACSAATDASACKNEVTPGITLDRLVNLLKVDPARPISVILVGIGPDADIRSLQRIADTVGGRAYRAKSADDMEGIIIDSLLHRQCGSTCK
ncbi:MAG TPA: substrate-binding domain-containing protein, partial [Actinopolymorphaceae bacterium]|nr:substrate-binding domain-containing protein [Actinopolymorphaceae bacterium]